MWKSLSEVLYDNYLLHDQSLMHTDQRPRELARETSRSLEVGLGCQWLRTCSRKWSIVTEWWNYVDNSVVIIRINYIFIKEFVIISTQQLSTLVHHSVFYGCGGLHGCMRFHFPSHRNLSTVYSTPLIEDWGVTSVLWILIQRVTTSISQPLYLVLTPLQSFISGV